MLLEETKKGTKLVKGFLPLFDQQKGFEGSADCNIKGGKTLDYILYFPLYNGVNSLEIGLDEGASVGHGRVYRDIKPILYYGSSITQGGCASRPDNSYQALISKWNNIDFINLGFSGSARGETVMVDYLKNIDCSLFVCDYDHNAPTADHLEKTHYALYESYRKARKDTPILFLTRPDYKAGQNECERRERIVRETYERAKAQGDNNVYFIAGRTFFTTDRQNCTVDGCHPNDLGFYKMAKKIYAKMQEIDGIFH
jgi:lysophospholipase L1-like esterase